MAMQQMTVTLTGNLGADPTPFGRDPNRPAASMRVGSTPRYLDARDNTWKDRATSWVNVRAYRALANNALASLRKGDAVIVVGTLRCETWEKDGVQRVNPVVEATAIGHDLNSGESTFKRNLRRPATDATGAASAATQTGQDPYVAQEQSQPQSESQSQPQTAQPQAASQSVPQPTAPSGSNDSTDAPLVPDDEPSF